MNNTRTALYYPEIVIPSKQFIRKTILYWDEIGSIVPQTIWDEHPDFVLDDEETNQLKSAGLYRPFFPHKLMNAGIPDFETIFQDEFYKRLDFFNNKDSLKKNTQYTPVYQEKEVVVTPLYQDKEMVVGLFDELEQRGLAKRKLTGANSVYESKHPTYFIESVTANIYMALLAEFLSDIDDKITVPVTENVTWRDYTYSTIDPNKKKICANLILDKILPIPKDDVPLEKIIQFKKDHKTELSNLRMEIDGFQASISSKMSMRAVQDSYCHFSEKVDCGVRDIQQSLKERNIDTFFGSMQAVLDVKSPEISSALLNGVLVLGTAQPLFC